MARATRGERDAFAEIYRRYHAAVYRFARMMGQSSGIAEDVTQETFCTLMQDLHRYDPIRAGLCTYLYGVTRNHTRNRLRRERRFVTLGPSDEARPAPPSDPCADLARAQELARLRSAIAMLPSRYREVVILCDLHGLSYADAALVIGAPIGTVRSRLSRGRGLIADRLLERSAAAAPTVAQPARCVV